jgi:hypothetical protein
MFKSLMIGVPPLYGLQENTKNRFEPFDIQATAEPGR